MYQSPGSTSENVIRGSSESKKRKSLTQIPDDQSTASSTESRRTNISLAIERNTASPVTSEGSFNTRSVVNNDGSSPSKTVLIKDPTEQLDSDVATEDGSNTTKEAASRVSSVIGSPPPKLEDGTVQNESGSNKKPRFSDDCQSPVLSRQRSYTFSTAHDYSKQPVAPKNPFDPLAWLASIAEREHEVDAAKSLFELSHDANQDLAEREEEEGEDDQDNEVSGEYEDDNEEDETDAHYDDPYLNGTAGHSRSSNDLRMAQDPEFSATSYFQSFQEKAKLWKTNPFMIHDPSNVNNNKVLDPLELLTSSADLVASPMSKRTLNIGSPYKEGLREMTLLPFPNTTMRSGVGSSSGSGLINFHDRMSEMHYLDTMSTDLQNISHSNKVTGRARSASMSLIEGSSTNPAFDNPALARIKGKLVKMRYP